jgi:hypothetical protein
MLQGSAGREGCAPHDRVVGQAFLDCDFDVALGKEGLDKKAEAKAHRFETYFIGFHDRLSVLHEFIPRGDVNNSASAAGRMATDSRCSRWSLKT